MPPPTNPKPPSLPLRVTDLLLILILSLAAARLMGGIVVGLTAGTRPAAPGPATILLFLGLQNLFMVGAAYLVAVRWNGIAWRDLGLRPFPRYWFGRAAVFAILAFPLISLVNVMVQGVIGELPPNPQLEVLAPVGRTGFGMIGMLVMVGLIGPFAEELLLRGVFYGWLRERWGVPASALASGVCFSLLHGIVWLIPAITLLGVILALIYEYSRSLWPAIVAHGTYNAISIMLLFAALALSGQS